MSAAVHPTYTAYAAPEPGFSVVGTSLFASDAVVYKTAYYSVNGATWVPFNVSGVASVHAGFLAGAVCVAVVVPPVTTCSSGETFCGTICYASPSACNVTICGRSCTVTYGTQTGSCSAGTWAWSACNTNLG